TNDGTVTAHDDLTVVALSIEKHADNNQVEVGSQIGYSVTVTGSGPAKAVTLNDPLPPGPAANQLNWTPASVSGKLSSGSCHLTGSAGAQTLTCDAVDLGTGADGSSPESYTVHITSPTNPNGPGFTIKNIGVATASNHSPVKDDDTTTGDTCALCPGGGNTIIVSALSIEKHADKNEVTVGDPIGYSVTVTGSGPATAVTLNDPLPPAPAHTAVTSPL